MQREVSSLVRMEISDRILYRKASFKEAWDIIDKKINQILINL